MSVSWLTLDKKFMTFFGVVSKLVDMPETNRMISGEKA